MITMSKQSISHDPLQPHSHEPNPAPPTSNPTFQLTLPNSQILAISVADLQSFPQLKVPNCYIVSTGHGTSGPFMFEGVTLQAFIDKYTQEWAQAEVVSGDGFGTRIFANEVTKTQARPILLALKRDGKPLSREDGLVRLIVPSEIDDALRQVKWVAQINLLA